MTEMEVSELKYAKATGVDLIVAYTSRNSEITRHDLFEICSNIYRKSHWLRLSWNLL